MRLAGPFLALLVCASIPASATTLLPADFPAMARESDLIVHGRVVDVRAQLAGPRRTIESTVTLQVASASRGPPERRPRSASLAGRWAAIVASWLAPPSLRLATR